jgi:cyclic pyranopterin phosphate synthase
MSATSQSPVTALPPPRPRDRLGRPLHDLRISVTDRCNFRCPYCMPRERYPEHYRFLKSAERLSYEEIVRLTRLFVHLGAKKLRITGGEPLLRAGLTNLIGDLNGLPGVEDIALTTNGVLLAQQAVELRAAGLQRVTVSLDTLEPAIFAQMSGGFGTPGEVLEGLAVAQRAGLGPLKINTVVQRGVNDHTVIDLLRHFRGTGVVVRFIEYMDVGNRNAWQLDEVVSSAELIARIQTRWPLTPVESTYRGEVAKRYAFVDGGGELGFISSVTQPFCGDCTRARLSSDGVLYTCLFANHGVDLRAPLRGGASDEELLALISGTWRQREDRYSERRKALNSAPVRRVEMNYVGG